MDSEQHVVYDQCQLWNVRKMKDWVVSFKQVACVIGSAFLILVAARNSITWHVAHFWGISGDFWQKLFDSLYTLFGSDDFNACVYGTFSITVVMYWLYNVFFIVLDMTGRPEYMLRYKIQPHANRPLDPKKFMKAMKWVLINQIPVSFSVVFFMYYAFRARGCPMHGELPPFHWFLIEFSVFLIIEEIGFYYTHRFFHRPSFYKHIHKIHHEWQASISIIPPYCHPLEHVISNLLPVYIGPLIMGSHLGTFWLWTNIALHSATISHCGYHLPFFSSPEAHDYHHLKFNQNYGTLGVLDRLHGTDRIFRTTKEYQRHFMLLSLTPVRELFPDDSKTCRKDSLQ